MLTELYVSHRVTELIQRCEQTGLRGTMVLQTIENIEKIIVTTLS